MRTKATFFSGLRSGPHSRGSLQRSPGSLADGAELGDGDLGGALLPLPKNPTPRSRPFGPRYTEPLVWLYDPPNN